eukprot:SAG31_NODE_1395_length_8516_cov_4.162885_6_plen_458_part_00
MIINVTGNASPFEMRPKFDDIFCNALRKATESTGAWVTTGGTDGGVMKLVGRALATNSHPVLGIAPWGVITGRRKLLTATVAERVRIAQQAGEKKALAFADVAHEDVGTAQFVQETYTSNPNGWADPPKPSLEQLRRRISYLRGDITPMVDLGLIDSTGRPTIAAKFPCYRTGKVGRGSLGMWGVNLAIDVVVTRKSEGRHSFASKTSKDMKLQVAVMRRSGKNGEEVWALPGKFVTSIPDVERLTILGAGEERDQLEKKAVRRVFEIDLLQGDGPSSNEIDLMFRKSRQTLVHRGYANDPRNTDTAWIESSVFHVHVPQRSALAADFEHSLPISNSTQKRSLPGAKHTWLNVYCNDLTRSSHSMTSLQLFDDSGTEVKLYGGHFEFVEHVVLGHFLGSRDLPVNYDGQPLEPLEAKNTELCKLDANHSHYICVDDGSRGTSGFGCEVAIRADLESL